MAENEKPVQPARKPRRRGGAMTPAEKPKDFRGSLKKLLKYMGHFRLTLFFILVFAAGGTVFTVIGPKIMARATNALADGLMAKIAETGGIDFTYIGKILLITLALYAFASGLHFIQGWLMTGVTQKVCMGLRRDISEKINRMPMKYFESHTYGEVLSRITNDVDTLGMGLNQSVAQVITNLCTIVGVIIMMLSISPLMTLIAVIMVPLSVVLIAVLAKFSQKHFRTQQEYLGHINGEIEETYGGQLVIKAFAQEEVTLERFDKTNDVLFKSAWRSQFLSGLMQPLMVFVSNMGYAGVAIAGGSLAIKGVIKIGDIQAFIQYVKSLTMPIQQLANIINMLQSMMAATERVFEFLDEEEEIETGNEKLLPAEIHGDVSFEHVSFGYNPDEPVIHDFSADVSRGQKIAIVGPTGAGKTTMVKLLMRFYDVDKGCIKLDGMDIRDFRRSDLRSNFGMVLQDTWLYKGSIMENIRYGKLDATDEEVIEAAKAAHVHHFVKTLPGGYNMELNEEATNISQGQKQLLTIARTILADNRVLILDEATSSVDTRTEELIQKAMDNLMEGRTSFIIAHRLSTIRNADMILVMDKGDIVEQGTHDELLEKGGFYAELYNSQFEE